MRTTTLCLVAVGAAACGGAAQSVHSTTTSHTVVSARLPQMVTVGHLQFELPASWKVGYGTCRCGFGQPDTATLDNGPQGGGVECSCPAEISSARSGLHLYEGQTGLIPGGTPTVLRGLQALVSLDTANATLTATFPGLDQWIMISPAPPAESPSIHRQQFAVEKEILGTVSVDSEVNPAP